MKVNYAAETAETVLHHRCSAETALRQAPNTGRQHALAPLGSASDSNVSEAIGLDDAGTARDLDRCARGRLIARPGLLHLAVITVVRSRVHTLGGLNWLDAEPGSGPRVRPGPASGILCDDKLGAGCGRRFETVGVLRH